MQCYLSKRHHLLPRRSPLSRCLRHPRHVEVLTGISNVCTCTFRARKRDSYCHSHRGRESERTPPGSNESFCSFTSRRARCKTTSSCWVCNTKVIVMRSFRVDSTTGLSKVVERLLVTARLIVFAFDAYSVTRASGIKRDRRIVAEKDVNVKHRSSIWIIAKENRFSLHVPSSYRARTERAMYHIRILSDKTFLVAENKNWNLVKWDNVKWEKGI